MREFLRYITHKPHGTQENKESAPCSWKRGVNVTKGYQLVYLELETYMSVH